jgi:hypothetical protein
MVRLLQGRPATVTLTVEVDEVLVDAAVDPAPTATVVNDAGDVVDFPSVVEVVGGHVCTLPAIRNVGGAATLTEAQASDELLKQIRIEFEDLAERHCSVSFTPRYSVFTVVAGPAGKLRVPRGRLRVIRSAVRIDRFGNQVVEDPAGWTVDPAGWISRPGRFAPGEQVTVAVEHGYTRPPAQLTRVAAIWCRDEANRRRTDADRRRVWAQTDLEGTTTRFSTARGHERPTGIPDVDQVLGELDVTTGA